VFGSHVTGIELGADCCVLVRSVRRGSRTTVSSARAVTPGEWSNDRETLADVLRTAKRTNRMPHKARVVVWGPQSPRGVTSEVPALTALVDAGFEIDRVLSPAQALADLVAAYQPAKGRQAVAAMALNADGATVAVVSGGEVLCSRTFAWALGKPFTGKHSELLDRYLVISELAPQLQHLIKLAGPVFGVKVPFAIACGNLPNLRSLMMLLIDEMDLEVETLDSAELLEPSAATGRLSESAAALQLAAAASVSAAGTSYAEVNDDVGRGKAVLPAVTARRLPPPPRAASHARMLVAIAAVSLCAAWTAREGSGWSPVTPFLPGGAESASSAAIPDLPTAATMGRIQPPAVRPEPEAPREAPPPVKRPSARVRPPAPSLSEAPADAIAADPPPPPPVPKVDGIMISGDRRLAIVGGDVVAPGDRVGTREVIQIERDGVVLREPGGREIRLAIRTRKPPTGSS
jgi:hypothetical protein